MILYPALALLKRGAWSQTLNVSLRGDVPEDAPPDLRDRNGWYDVARDGYPVANYLLPNDVARGLDVPVAGLLKGLALAIFAFAMAYLQPSMPTVLTIATGLAVAVLTVYTIESSPKMIMHIGMTVVTLGLWPALLLLTHGSARGKFLLQEYQSEDGSKTKKLEAKGLRNDCLLEQTMNNNLSYYKSHWHHTSELRRQQAEAANADKSAFIALGNATGQFYYNHDPLAAQAGLTLGMSASDFSTHLVVFGATGTGKTAGVLRPVAKQWSEANGGGLLVLDGKGDLPREMVSLPDFQLVTPETSELALLEGLIAEDVVDALASIGAGDQKMDFWRASGEAMLRASAVLLENAQDREIYPWTLSALHQVINREEYRRELIISFKDHPDVETEGQIGQAVRYWLHEFDSLSPNTAGSVVGTVNSWINPILGHRDLINWSRASTGVDPSIVLQGGRVGVAVPAYKYGSAGVAVTALVKQRVYRAVRRRGSSWRNTPGQTALLMLIDEAQEVLSSADMDMWPVARSLGLAGVIATQSVDELVARFGKDRALAMLNNFRSLISYKSSDLTVEYACKRAGSHLRLASSIKEKGFQLTGGNKGGMVKHPHFRMFAGAAAANPLNDPGYKSRIKGGFTSGWSMRGMLQQLALDSSVYEDFTMVEHETISFSEANQLLEKKFHALAVLSRGGITRRDVIETKPIFV